MTFAEWFANLEAQAKTELAVIGAEAEKVAVAVGTVVVQDVEQALEQLGALAVSAVIAEAPKLISGQEKFGNAVASVVQQTEAAGRAVLINDAQMAVQGAFRAVQVAVSRPMNEGAP